MRNITKKFRGKNSFGKGKHHFRNKGGRGNAGRMEHKRNKYEKYLNKKKIINKSLKKYKIIKTKTFKTYVL